MLGQANQIRVFVWHDADPHFADDRAEVMRAGAAHGDQANDHQFIPDAKRSGTSVTDGIGT